MARTIPQSVAGVVEHLELEGDPVVTVSTLREILAQLESSAEARRVAYVLQQEGWLGSLRTRSAWEFFPGARAGAYSSGDRFIEFRAQRAVAAAWPGVLAMESAASVLGLAQRAPEKEVVALPTGLALPKALVGDWRSVGVHLPDEAVTSTREGLPSWNLEGLLAGIAIRPSGYNDIPGLAQWLPEAAAQADTALLAKILSGAAASAKQRATFLLGAGGNTAARDWFISRWPAQAVAWFGSRDGDGVFDSASQVNDTVLYRYLDAGVGA